MPRGIPKEGKRKAGAGRPRKYSEPTYNTRVPVSFKGKIDDIYLFLGELDAELASWEREMEGKDMAKNPRWAKAKLLAESIRERLDGLGIIQDGE